MKLSGNLGAPTVQAPELAYRRPDVYQDGLATAPRNDEMPYKDYVFLGRIPVNENEGTQAATAIAKAKYGPKAKVFQTARYWIAYEIR